MNKIINYCSILLIFFSSCSNQDFSKLKIGMKKDEVIKLVGKPTFSIKLPLQEIWCYGENPQKQIWISKDTIEFFDLNPKMLWKINKDGTPEGYTPDLNGKRNTILIPKEDKNGKYGYVNDKGEVVIDYIYGQAWDFKNGYATVFSNKNKKCGIINEKGNLVIDYKYDWIDYNDGIFCVNINNKLGFVDTLDNVIIPIKYEEVGESVDGLLEVKKDGQWGYIDHNDKTVIPFQYEERRNSFEGLFVVKKDNKWGFIDKKGNTVIPFKYSDVGAHYEGSLIEVTLEGKSILIDKTGKYVKDTPK